MRLDKYLSYAGYGTRKEVKQLIRQRHVSINGVPCRRDDQKIDETKDIICVDNTTVNLQMTVYIMVYKPAGVISAVRDSYHETVMDLIDEPLPPGCFPVGRLDRDTEGLLLITNDGVLAHELLHPKKHIDKTYYVEAMHPLKKDAIIKLRKGIIIDGGEKCLPADVKVITDTGFLLTIREGKYHQIKRMLKALDNQVIYLKRLRMGSLHLDETLEKGTYRHLYEEEIQQLKNRKEPT